ncbi:MAG TPA: hypothetical protein VFL91_20735, partial [Thermomicrobiales bacterium]|nr:hypothetical protein [Thermomicrobiales bacterium]
MQVHVSVAVEVPASGALDEVERAVLAAGRRAMARRCGRRAARSRRRWSPARMAGAAPGAARGRTGGCSCAASGGLAALGGADVTPAPAGLCAPAGASWAYATAERVVAQWRGAPVSAGTVRLATVRAGGAERRAQDAAAAAVVAPAADQVRAQDAAERGRRPPAAAPAPRARLLVGLDGGWVPSREQPGGLAGNAGVLATGAARAGAGRRQLAPRRCVATFGGGAAAGALAYAAATALGGDRAREQVVPGDGAGWIEARAAGPCPDAVAILDRPHAARAVHKAIRPARPGAARREERRALHHAIPEHPWRGRVDEAL